MRCLALVHLSVLLHLTMGEVQSGWARVKTRKVMQGPVTGHNGKGSWDHWVAGWSEEQPAANLWTPVRVKGGKAQHVVFWNSSNSRLHTAGYTLHVTLGDYVKFMCPVVRVSDGFGHHSEESRTQSEDVDKQTTIYLVPEIGYKSCDVSAPAFVRFRCADSSGEETGWAKGAGLKSGNGRTERRRVEARWERLRPLKDAERRERLGDGNKMMAMEKETSMQMVAGPPKKEYGGEDEETQSWSRAKWRKRQFIEKIQLFTPFSLGAEFIPGREYHYISLLKGKSFGQCLRLKMAISSGDVMHTVQTLQRLRSTQMEREQLWERQVEIKRARERKTELEMSKIKRLRMVNDAKEKSASLMTRSHANQAMPVPLFLCAAFCIILHT
uniref:uncharacterized protein n=1 Tax=Myxine glutinosa TaxID=7769 RepID=UPI00358FA876